MHELAVCQALLHEVCRVAEAQGATDVSRVIVWVGPLSGVEPALLERAFEIARVETPARHAELILEFSGVQVRCRNCGAVSSVSPTCLLCPRCGDFHTELLAGDELMLKRVELTVVAAGANADRGEPVYV